MITCPNCGKENQDRHKFCLGCGARLPAGAPGQHTSPGSPYPMPPPVPGTPMGGPEYQGGGSFDAVPPPPVVAGHYPPPPGPPPPLSFNVAPSAAVPLPVAPGPPPPPPGPLPPDLPVGTSGPTASEGVLGACVRCGFGNPPGFAFCGRCGQRLGETAAPEPVEDVGSARTVFVADAPAEFREAAAAFRAGNTASPATPGPVGGNVPAPPPVVTPPPEISQPAAATPTAAPIAPAPSPAPSPSSGTGPGARLVMLGPDGQPMGERILAPGETLDVGRDGGPPWDEDAYLDRKHGRLAPTEEGITVSDLGSLNGIFVKLAGRMELQHGDQFRVGQELMLYEDLPEPTPTADGTERMGSPNPGYWGRLSLMVDPKSAAAAYPIHGEGVRVGRETGDICFPQDGYVSGNHCRVFGDDTGVYLEDTGSSNGTYMRVRNGATVPYGSLVLIGQKLFQIERT